MQSLGGTIGEQQKYALDFACTSSENDRFECDRSKPFNSWLKYEVTDIIHLSFLIVLDSTFRNNRYL